MPRARAPRRTRVLGEQRGVRVVVDEDRQPEPLGHDVAERHAAQRQVHGATPRSRARWSTSDGIPKPTPATGAVGRVAQPPRPRRRSCRAPRPRRAPRARRWARWWTFRSLVDDARRGASCRPGRRRSHSRRAWRCHHTPLPDERPASPRSTRSTAPGRRCCRRKPATPTTASASCASSAARDARRAVHAARAAPRRPAARRPITVRPRRSSGSRSRSAAGSRLSLVVFLVSAQIQQGKVADATERRARRRRPARSTQPDDDPRARLRPAQRGHRRAGRADDRHRPQRLDHAPARRRRREQPPVDRPRHDRRHPRRRAPEDQRRLRDRRRAAGDPDDLRATSASTSTTSSR